MVMETTCGGASACTETPDLGRTRTALQCTRGARGDGPIVISVGRSQQVRRSSAVDGSQSGVTIAM